MKFINLYNCCKIISGAKLCLIIDVERNIYAHIPIEIYNFINHEIEINIENKEITTFLDILVENNFCYYDSKKEYLNNSEEFFTPYIIEDILIDIYNLTDFYLKISKIDIIPEFLQIRIFGKINESDFSMILHHLTELEFFSVEILMNDIYLTIEKYLSFISEYQNLSRLIIFNSISTYEINENENLIVVKNKLINEKQCGIIKEDNFSINLRTFLNSKIYNSCLNKKISIDIQGKIKNCPSMSYSYGDINKNNLSDILKLPDFKKYWGITKDQINVCKDCEFRYICTDCRAYTERNSFNDLGNDVSKPLKCGYNPYTNEWSKWNKNPLKENLITFYNLNEII